MNYKTIKNNIEFALSQVKLESKTRNYKVVFRYRGDREEQFFSVEGNGDEITKKLEDCLTSYASRPEICSLRVEIYDGKGGLQRKVVIIEEDSALAGLETIQYAGRWERPNNNGGNDPQTQQTAESATIAGLKANIESAANILGMFGFPVPDTSLNGTDSNPLSTLLRARDMNRDREYEQRRTAELYEEQKKVLEEKNQYIAKLERKLAKAEDNIDRCKDYIEELEKLKPESTLFGTSLVGIGTGIVQGVLRNNAGLIGSLLGVDPQTALAGLGGGGAVAPAKDTKFALDNSDDDDDVTVSKVDNSPRGENIKIITDWIRGLDDTEYQQLINILDVLMKNKGAISTLYSNWQSAAQQQQQGVYHAVSMEDDEVENAEM